MSAYCDGGFDNDDPEWWFEHNEILNPLSTKRSRICISCETKVAVGDDVLQLERHKRPENDIEERIYGDEVPIATWYLCEDCGCALLSIFKLGAGIALEKGENLQIVYRELRAQEKAEKGKAV